MAIPEGTTLEEIAEYLRTLHCSAVSLTLFVNYYDHEVTMKRVAPDRKRDANAPTYRRLDGQWAHF